MYGSLFLRTIKKHRGSIKSWENFSDAPRRLGVRKSSGFARAGVHYQALQA